MGPDSDTHLHYIKQLDAMEIASMVNGAIAEMLDVAKKYYSIDRHVDVAIDVTYIAYYGDRDEFQMSVGAPSNKSYSWCYEMATISIVGEEVKFTLGMRPLCRRIPYMPRAVLMEQLLDIASEHVSIGTVYADAGFDSIGVMHVVEEAGFSYLIRNSRTTGSIDSWMTWTTTSPRNKPTRWRKPSERRRWRSPRRWSGFPRIARRMRR